MIIQTPTVQKRGKYMTHIELGKVDIGIEDTPMLNRMYKENPQACERAIVVGDMSVLFAGLIKKFGVPDTANYIETALKNALEITGYEKGVNNATSSD